MIDWFITYLCGFLTAYCLFAFFYYHRLKKDRARMNKFLEMGEEIRAKQMKELLKILNVKGTYGDIKEEDTRTDGKA